MEAVQLLIPSTNSNADILDATNWTPLHYACTHGHIEIVSHLVLRAGSNPNITTPAGYSSLSLACTSSVCPEDNALKVIKFLTTAAKCNPNNTIINGDTLLIYLLKRQTFRFTILRYLILEYQCSLMPKNHDFNTALHIACEKKTSNPYVVKWISNRGHQYAVIKNLTQETPLHVACRNGMDVIVSILLSSYREACVLYEVDKNGDVPLLLAFKSGNLSIVPSLISKMYSQHDKNGNTPLHLATMMENIPLLQLMIKTKYDATAINNYGDTALHIACKIGNPKLIKVVFNLNSDAQVIFNKNCDTPAHIACLLDDQLLLDMLQNI